MPAACKIVVPCYNEAERLRVEAFRLFAQREPEVDFLFVNDGSTDRTLEVLRALERSAPNCFEVLDLAENRGKAEAVRAGLCAAFKSNADCVGYWDADLATPLDEIPRFRAVLEREPQVEVVFGARVQMLGRRVQRRPLRHYLGRVFATAVSLVLRLPIYDTQCGAKLMRRTPELGALFETPFLVNWTFDVEWLARLSQARRRSGGTPVDEAVYEQPLERWEDVAGSKVRPGDFFVAFFEVARIWYRYGGRGS
jgi:glycosyltransferase involved in cell wall biosynthesis